MLTPKQEKFCLVYVETGSASEAYRQAYDVKPDTKPANINRQAKAIIDNPKIASRIKELQKPAQDAAMVTLEQHVKKLQELRDAAQSNEKYDAAIKAEVSIGKACGLYTEKVDVTSGGKAIKATWHVHPVKPKDGSQG